MFIHSENDKHLVILNRGEKVMESLTQVAKKLNLKGGLISGIGALENLELGFYHLNQKSYDRKSFDQGEFELLNLTGNISLKEGEPFVHVHATFSGEDFNAFGGHVFEAETAVTCEIYITPLGAMPEREFNTEVGLHTICKIAP